MKGKGGGIFFMICVKLVIWVLGSGIFFDILYVGGLFV